MSGPPPSQHRWKDFKSLLLQGALTVAFLALGALAMERNLNFISVYDESRAKWLEVARLASQAPEGPLKIPEALLHHPYILTISPAFMEKYVERVFHRRACITSDFGHQFLLSSIEHDPIQLRGFEGIEPDGRWTQKRAEIRLGIGIEKDDEIHLIFSGAFASNYDHPTLITIGSIREFLTFNKSSEIRLKIQEDLTNPTLTLEPFKTESPKDYGNPGDPRDLGVKLKSLEIERRRPDGSLVDVFDVCM